MGRLDILLAASAISVALLAAASGAVAAADDGDSAASASASSGDSDSGADQSTDQSTDQSADHTDANTYGSNENDRTAGDQSGDVGQNDTDGAEESGDEQDGEKKPVDDDSGSDIRDGKTINRMPVLIPEAPPPVDLAPFPEELPPLPLEPVPLPLEPVPPPVDLPPAVPGEPDPVDVTPLGPGAALPDGNAPPILTFPVVVARAGVPAPAPPRHILGASLAPRATSVGQAVTSTPRWAGESAPPLRRASTSDPLLREPPPSNVGLSARGQTSIQSGYNSVNLPRGRLSEMAAGALPGVAGMVIMTASGICLGYRQAMAGQLLRNPGADRFLA